MAGVKAETEQAGVGVLQEMRDFIRRFDEASAMVVKDRAQARLLANGKRDSLDTFGKRSPLRVSQTFGFRDSPGALCAYGVCAVVVCQDDEWRVACNRCEEPRRFEGHFLAGRMSAFIGKGDWNKSADH